MNYEDEKIRHLLTMTPYDIPESYYQKVDRVIMELAQDTNDTKKKGIFVYRYVKAAVILTAFIVVSGTTYAAVNYYQQRMSSLSGDEIKKYNEDVQNVQAEKDVYSRKLSYEEKRKMMELRVCYEEDGRFPKEEIIQVVNKLDEECDYVYFSSMDSTFYIPDRKLTDEELLEIIDLQEKRDYSVRNQNSVTAEDKIVNSTNELIPDEENYLAKVANVFALEESKLDISSESKRDDVIEGIISGYDSTFEVTYSEKNGVYRIKVSKGEVSAHSGEEKINESDINIIEQCISERVPIFTEQKVEKMEMYYLADEENNMVSGTVSVYCYMSDGSGCVAVYSLVYQDIYDIYVLADYDEVSETISNKKKSAESNCREYVKLQN